MTATLPTTNIWQNADGLRVKFGLAEADRTGAFVGEYEDLAGGNEHVTHAVVDLAVVAASTSPYILSPTVSIPNGAYIRMVDVIPTVETAGSNANLDFGLVDQDCATELDFNGLLAAADIFNAGTDLGKVFTYYPATQDSAGVAVSATTEGGALLGTILTNTGLLCMNYDTAAFTAGRLSIKVYWSMPIVPNS